MVLTDCMNQRPFYSGMYRRVGVELPVVDGVLAVLLPQAVPTGREVEAVPAVTPVPCWFVVDKTTVSPPPMVFEPLLTPGCNPEIWSQPKFPGVRAPGWPGTRVGL